MNIIKVNPEVSPKDQLATDYHRYTPISMEQVEWFANAIQYWDHNVFCEKASVYGL